MNPLTALPEKVRQALYVVYAIAGPVLIWSASKGWTGDSEYQLWIGLGTALGLVAVANTGAKPRVRVPVEDVPHVPNNVTGPSGV